eukprot:3756650-Rhodomonas_salina.8
MHAQGHGVIPTAASTTSLSAPPIPRSGCTNAILALAFPPTFSRTRDEVSSLARTNAKRKRNAMNNTTAAEIHSAALTSSRTSASMPPCLADLTGGTLGKLDVTSLVRAEIVW